jgi:hypothetical protein
MRSRIDRLEEIVAVEMGEVLTTKNQAIVVDSDWAQIRAQTGTWTGNDSSCVRT